ncbi:uncharacterized protein LOC127101827 [Lathyrus oleraceus]|uniref:uncharacterized protein LOC127101827 n=1 Tax=Pisum sativum TaxID=3888 RepID=UPI0021D2BD41|nr:uncharacterized protein LOC127101827 [Pisum sativum]
MVKPKKIWIPKNGMAGLIAHTSLRESAREDEYFDSGCSRKMTGVKKFLMNIKSYSTSYVTFGDGSKGEIKGIGMLAYLGLHSLDDVLFVKGLTANLISIIQLCDQGIKVNFNKYECIVTNEKDEAIIKGARSKDKFYLWTPQETDCFSSCLMSKEEETNIWHQKLGHLHMKGMKKVMSKEALRGIPKLKIHEGRICGECKVGKQTKMSRKKLQHLTTSKIMELLHMDLMGLVRVGSLRGKREKDCGIIRIRSDHGKEFENNKFEEFFTSEGISHEFYSPITPQQSGVVERKNRTIQECARVMLHAKKLPYHFWDEVMNTACYILNRVTIRSGTSATLYELWKRRKPAVKYFHVFGMQDLTNEADVTDDVETSTDDVPEDVADTNTNTKTTKNDSTEQGPSVRIQKDHPKELIIGNPNEGIITKSREVVSNACFVSKFEPKNIKEALTDELWISAMQDKLGQSKRNKVWDLVPRPVGTMGRRQKQIARLESIGLLLGMACLLKFKLFQMDVKRAFLNGYLNEDVYVEQPKGFIDPTFPNHIYKLKKALYGLKQAPRAWYERMTELLINHGYRKGGIDKTLFVKEKDGKLMIAQTYMDDVVFGGMSHEMVQHFVKQMQSEFEMSLVGELTYFLGLQVKQMEDSVFLCQSKYARSIVKKFGLESESHKRTPAPTHLKLSKDEKGLSVNQSLYRSMIGNLLYLIANRLDITFVVGVCARYQVEPKVSHINQVKRILNYVNAINEYGMLYSHDSNSMLVGYCDVYWDGIADDRKITFGGYKNTIGEESRLKGYELRNPSMHADDSVNPTAAERSATDKELRKFVASILKEVNSDVFPDVQTSLEKDSCPDNDLREKAEENVPDHAAHERRSKKKVELVVNVEELTSDEEPLTNIVTPSNMDKLQMFFDLANAQGIKTASTCLVVIPPPMISTITLVIIAAPEVDQLTNVVITLSVEDLRLSLGRVKRDRDEA